MKAEHGREVRPFVKWVGGKQALVPQLRQRLPPQFERYYEPFLGGGALFFALQPPRAFLSDVNPDLMLVYQVVRDHVGRLLPLLDGHRQRHSPEYFYRMRERFNLRIPVAPESEKIERVALFLYLNKSCYNGLFRLNSSGQFNSPVGSYTQITIYQKDNLFDCSTALKKVRLLCRGFQRIRPRKEDFVYFDPPYHQNFSNYHHGGFGEAEQRQLAAYCQRLNQRGVRFMLSNSDTPLVRQLYHSFCRSIEVLQASRSVNCRGDQRKAQELLIRNY